MNPCVSWEERVYFERVTAIGFTIDHVADFIEYAFARMIPGSPVISRSTAVFGEEDVLWII
jgi:hypothetical protein